MRVVVVYDIDTTDSAGRKRLRKVAKTCSNWGTPVQRSVYECDVDADRYRTMKQQLAAVCSQDKDSIRIYHLGTHYQSRIESVGKADTGWDRETFVV